MMAHTPRPWIPKGLEVFSSNGRSLAILPARWESQDNVNLIAAAPDLLAVVIDGLFLKGGWREAIVELEDWCSEPVRLKNMLAAADQLDRWAQDARAAIIKTEGEKS